MLYLDFDKFKSEAKRLKKILSRVYPKQPITLSDSQKMIAISVGMNDLNMLYLAHEKRVKAMPDNIDIDNIIDCNKKPLAEWAEFNNHPVFLAWIRERQQRLQKHLTESYPEPEIDISIALDEMWDNRVNHTLLNAKNEDVGLSTFREKDWRSGVTTLLLDGDQHVNVAIECLPKLKRDGGLVILNEAQAIDFMNALQQHDSPLRVPINIFNTVRGDEDKLKVCSHPALRPYASWPLHRENAIDATLLRTFQHTNAWQYKLWGGRSVAALDSYYQTCQPSHATCHSPSLTSLIDIACDESIPDIKRHGLKSMFTLMGVDLKTKTTTKMIEEQYQYTFNPATSVTSYFSEPLPNSKSITLSEWAGQRRLSIIITPERLNDFSSNFIHGMISVLCISQSRLALCGKIQDMSKGLLIIPPFVNAKDYFNTVPTAPFRFCTLWGWIQPGNIDDYQGTKMWEEPQPADEHAGSLLLPTPDGDLILIYRLMDRDDKKGFYPSLRNSRYGNLRQFVESASL